MDTPRLDRIVRELERLQDDAREIIHRSCMNLADKRHVPYTSIVTGEMHPCGTTLNFVEALKRVKLLSDEPW
jgi:hypothetical protein